MRRRERVDRPARGEPGEGECGGPTGRPLTPTLCPDGGEGAFRSGAPPSIKRRRPAQEQHRMPDEVVIKAEGLTKRYRATLAVDHVDLEVAAGEIVGILGPNGSGKTTTILMLLGLTEPTSGTALVAGFDPLREPLEVKRRVGYLPDQVGFYDGLSARDNLAYTGRLAGLPRHEIDERFTAALDRVGLGDVGGARVATFSQGMRQRRGLAEVLMKRPSIAILDEPTATLDPHSTQEFLGMVRALK